MRSNLNPKLHDALRVVDLYDFATQRQREFYEMGYTEENNPDEWAKVLELHKQANTLMHELGVEHYCNSIWEHRDYESSHEVYDERWE